MNSGQDSTISLRSSTAQHKLRTTSTCAVAAESVEVLVVYAMLFVVLFAACYWILLPCLVIFAFRKLLRTEISTKSQLQEGDDARSTGDDVPSTPLTSEVTRRNVARPSCVRDHDIVEELYEVTLVGKGIQDTLRLPLNACSDAAADAIEAARGREGFPSSFDFVASGGGLIGFYGGAVTSVLGTLARRGVLQVKQLHGVSSGALCVATYLGVESGYTRMEDVYRCYQLFQRARWLSGEMRAFLDQCLPPDVHLRASGRCVGASIRKAQ